MRRLSVPVLLIVVMSVGAARGGTVFTLKDLGTLGGTSSYATGINASGQVVGWATTPNGLAYAFLYSDGVMKDLNDLIDPTLGWTLLHGSAINNSGQVVGDAITTSSSISRAFLYSDGEITDLGTLDGRDTFTSDINDSGQVVGWARTALYSTYDAFLYSDGVMKDLNDLIDPTLGWNLTRANAINDSGQIVGFGTNSSGETHAFLLTPVPAPSSLTVLVGVGMMVFGMEWWKKRRLRRRLRTTA